MPATDWSLIFKIASFVVKLIPWRKVMPTLAAKWLGVLTVKVVDTPRKDFRDQNHPDRPVVYTMTQAWLSNGTRIEIEDARCTLSWRRRGASAYEGNEVYGIWCKKQASGFASYSGGVEETTTLPSNGDDRHLGLVAKSARTGQVYLVCTATYYAAAHPNYEHPNYVLQPGLYDVEILIEAKGGRRGQIRLEVHNGGGTSEVITVVQ